MREKIECSLSATMIRMKCLALTGTPHCDPSEDRSRVAELSVLILFKMIESIDMTLCVISFLVLLFFSLYIETNDNNNSNTCNKAKPN